MGPWKLKSRVVMWGSTPGNSRLKPVAQVAKVSQACSGKARAQKTLQAEGCQGCGQAPGSRLPACALRLARDCVAYSTHGAQQAQRAPHADRHDAMRVISEEAGLIWVQVGSLVQLRLHPHASLVSFAAVGMI